MKKTITRLSSLSVVALMLFAACDSRHAAQPADSDADTTITEAIADSSVYGIVGEGTAMHTLEVITDVGDTLEFVLADADADVPTVLGGLLAGDRVAVVSHTADGEQVACQHHIAFGQMDQHRQEFRNSRRRHRGVDCKSRNKSMDIVETQQWQHHP